MRTNAALLALLLIVLAMLGPPPSEAAAPGDLQGSTALPIGTELLGVATQSDGRVVAVGSSGHSLLAERFDASGGQNFTGGQIFNAGAGVGRAVMLQPDGKIVVAGSDASGMLVERFTPAGSLDSGFGVSGVVHVAPTGQANAVALGPGGTIVVAGSVVTSDAYKRLDVVRLRADGSFDPSFGAGGSAVVDLGQDSVAHGVAVQGDGKVVLAGSVGPGTHQGVSGVVARLTASGGLDASFAGNGVYSYFSQNGGGAATLNAIALDPAGAIVAAGGDSQVPGPQAVFIRLTCAGVPVPGFGSGGIVTRASAVSYFGEPLGAAGVAVAAGDHIVGAGHYQVSGESFTGLWGLVSTGAQAFATHVPENTEANAIALDPSGNLVVAGDAFFLTGGVSGGFLAHYQGFGPVPAGGSPPPPPQAAGGCGARPPSVTSGGASGVRTSSTTVSGSVNGNGWATVYHFDYGKKSGYGSHSPSWASVSTGATNVSARLTRLAPGTTYHYRLVGTNVCGTSYGRDRTFTTHKRPKHKPPKHKKP